MRNCLIIDEIHPAIFPLLESVGIQYDYQPKVDVETVLALVGQFEGIIVRSKMKLGKEFFERATRLRYIARAGSGKDNIDVEEAERCGVAILNAPEGNSSAVAEHAVGLMLVLLNKIAKSNSEVKRGIWEREANRGTELGHLIVGIIGYGHTGRATANRLVAFNCEVLAYDIKGMAQAEKGVTLVSLEEMQRKADLISLHIPLDSRNRHFVNETFIDAFLKPFWLINTARGEVVQTKQLLAALQSGKILGAGLDVLENEKFSTYTEEQKEIFQSLASLPQVVMSPHVAGWTHESYLKISEILGNKIRAFYKEF